MRRCRILRQSTQRFAFLKKKEVSGALHTGQSTFKTDLLYSKNLKTLVKERRKEWLEFVDKNHSTNELVVVTGRHLTDSWTIASAGSFSHGVEIEFTVAGVPFAPSLKFGTSSAYELGCCTREGPASRDAGQSSDMNTGGDR